MKYAIPEISWHNRDPVLSVDFQPKREHNEPLRLATGGTDSHVLIWYVSMTDNGSANLEVAADLTRHQKAVNIVRWSPSGQYLASGDDESIILIWKLNLEKEPVQNMEQDGEQDKESWIIHKILRGHVEDVLDISWSADSLHIASGSVDNKLLLWDVSRGKYSSILSDHKGFVQGVAWDPKGQLIASASSDRVFRAFDVTTKKVLARSNKAILPFPEKHPFHKVPLRLYHDDTLQTFYRRLQFSPDGLLIAVPAGRMEPEQGKMDIKPINAVYIYTRYSLKVPACVLPCGDSAALVARWSPIIYRLRCDGPLPAFPARRRMLLAVATKGSVLLYDTQQKTPVALISNIHYTRLTDLTWSPDGRTLVASSTDGFCSVISFSEGELGEEAPDDEPDAEPMEVQPEEPSQAETLKTEEVKTPKRAEKSNRLAKIDSFMKFKAPEKSPKKTKTDKVTMKTPVKMDVHEEVAMPSWSDNSSSNLIPPKATEGPIVIEDSEDMKLVYEETVNTSENAGENTGAKEKGDAQKSTENKTESPKEEKSPQNCFDGKLAESQKTSDDKDGSNFLKQAKVTDIPEPVVVKAAPSPKAPRRVSFVTLSSPKNAKKK